MGPSTGGVADVPPGFTFAVKVGQFGTHRKKLTDPTTRREIAEMEWLIADIEENGVASTEKEASERPVPELDAEP